MGWTGLRATSKEDALRLWLEDARVLHGPVWSERGHAWIVVRAHATEVPMIVAVLLESGGGRLWYVKDVPEALGPTVVDCPVAWLALVPQAAGPYAGGWRERVLRYFSDRAAARLAQVLTDALSPDEASQNIIDAGGL
jgi:hypothetical protein